MGQGRQSVGWRGPEPALCGRLHGPELCRPQGLALTLRGLQAPVHWNKFSANALAALFSRKGASPDGEDANMRLREAGRPAE
jgi:hypothetical protein